MKFGNECKFSRKYLTRVLSYRQSSASTGWKLTLTVRNSRNFCPSVGRKAERRHDRTCLADDDDYIKNIIGNAAASYSVTGSWHAYCIWVMLATWRLPLFAGLSRITRTGRVIHSGATGFSWYLFEWPRDHRHAHACLRARSGFHRGLSIRRVNVANPAAVCPTASTSANDHRCYLPPFTRLRPDTMTCTLVHPAFLPCLSRILTQLTVHFLKYSTFSTLQLWTYTLGLEILGQVQYDI